MSRMDWHCTRGHCGPARTIRNRLRGTCLLDPTDMEASPGIARDHARNDRSATGSRAAAGQPSGPHDAAAKYVTVSQNLHRRGAERRRDAQRIAGKPKPEKRYFRFQVLVFLRSSASLCVSAVKVLSLLLFFGLRQTVPIRPASGKIRCFLIPFRALIPSQSVDCNRVAAFLTHFLVLSIWPAACMYLGHEVNHGKWLLRRMCRTYRTNGCS